MKDNDATVPLITESGVVEVSPDEALFVSGRVLANYGDCDKNIKKQLDSIANAGTIETLTVINFQEGYPEPSSMTLEEVRVAIASAKKTPEQQAVLFAQMTINNTDMTNNEALQLKEIHPEWKDFIGKTLKAKFRVRYEDRLYRVRQEISTVLANQPPALIPRPSMRKSTRSMRERRMTQYRTITIWNCSPANTILRAVLLTDVPGTPDNRFIRICQRWLGFM